MTRNTMQMAAADRDARRRTEGLPKKVRRPEAVRRPDAMRAPRPSWEPTPLHIPLPEPARDRSPHTEDISSPRGVVIISYGDEE